MKRDKQTQVACLLVTIQRPTGCTDERVDVELGERTHERDAGQEYPRTPEEVNGLFCEHGSLGLHAWAMNGRISADRPEYQRLAYLDTYKLGKVVKTLATIERRLSKMRDARGHVSSWADHVLRFAEATGAKWIAFPANVSARIDAHTGWNRNLHGERWAFVAPVEAARLLRELEASFAPKAQAAE